MSEVNPLGAKIKQKNKQIFSSIAVLIVIAFCGVACAKIPNSTIEQEGEYLVEWHDALFARAMGVLLDKDPHDIDYSDLEAIIKISIINSDSDEDGLVNIGFTLDAYRYANIDTYKESIQDYADLKYFVNLEELSIRPGKSFIDFELFNQIPKLKVLRFDQADFVQNNLHRIVNLNNITILHLPLFDADFSILEKMVNLEEMHFKHPGAAYSPKINSIDKILQTLPLNTTHFYCLYTGVKTLAFRRNL